MKRTSLITSISRTTLLSALGFVSMTCGKEDAKPATDDLGAGASGILPATRPADSTGTLTDIGFKLGTSTSAMALVAPQQIDAGGGVVITTARISIASIKIKAEKQESAEEVSAESEIKTSNSQEDKKDEAADKADELAVESSKASFKSRYESATTDAAKAVVKKDEEAAKQRIEAGKAARHEAKERAQIEREAAKDESMKWKGPYVYDAVKMSTEQAIPVAKILDGSYRRIEFKIKPNRSVAATDPLLNHSVYVSGTVSAGVSAPVTFVFRTRVDEEFKLMGAGSIKMEASAVNNVTVAFDVKSWFSGANLVAATQDADGIIYIDDKNNKQLYESIRTSIKKSTKFGEDKDGDGDIAEAESAGDGLEASTTK